MINKEDYVARISSASPLQLVIINYELTLQFIKDALENITKSQNQYEENIKKAQDSLGRLISTLDMDYDLSKLLFDLYLYVNKLLIKAFFSRSADSLTEAVEILEALLKSWEALENEVTSPITVMYSAQRIYAGLTYKNGELEEYIDDPGNRDYKV